MLDYRTLTPSEVAGIEETVRQIQPFEGHIEPRNVIVAGAFEPTTQELMAFWMAQTAIHCEPLYAFPKFRGRVDIIHLAATLEAEMKRVGIPEFFSFPTSDRVAHACKRFGMSPMAFAAWKKQVK